MKNFYDFQAKNIQSDPVSMDQFKNKVVLIVNVASKCGFTPQYRDLESLYKDLQPRGFEILGFPCNQFGAQEPGSEKDILEFCTTTYPVSFKMFSKVDVNGPNAHPLYEYLSKYAKTDAHKDIKAPKDADTFEPIKWNFTKFLIDRKGEIFSRFSPQTSPKDLKPFIEELLKIHN